MQTTQELFVKRIPICKLKDESLARLSEKKLLSLSLSEMQAIQRYFRSRRREPSDVELETIAQTWSEHCKHKTFRGKIEYTEVRSQKSEVRSQKKVYEDLLKETIFRATKELNKKFCLSVFKDNAGIISFNEKWALAFKVETHNHPSALEPTGGAGTGIGGVIRDILGAGLGAKPVLNTDVFCVGYLTPHPPPHRWASHPLPQGERGNREKSSPLRREDLGEGDYLSPEKILSGVVSGVRDYGNRMGIPTANGAVYFHDGFTRNPLVFCGSVGILPRNKIKKKPVTGDLIVSIGGRTGRDGIHGATFSSLALKEDLPSSLVQIGNAIIEKKVMDLILRAQEKNLYHAITDCGAGGYSSALGELAVSLGAKVFLENVPLKYAGMKPWEIWLSESQERMVLALSPKKLSALQNLCEIEDVELAVIGKFTKDKRLRVYFKGDEICNLALEFLHNGIPQVQKKAIWKSPLSRGVSRLCRDGVCEVGGCLDLSEILKKLLSHPNIASKKWIVRQYDQEVQGGSILKPFTGISAAGPNDAVVFKPLLDSLYPLPIGEKSSGLFPRPLGERAGVRGIDSWRGVVVSNGINPLYGELDPYWMAGNVIEEALRNLVAVGGDIRHCALLDNFCWGDTNNPEILGGLVRCAQGCYDFAKEFGVPFISGKDSLNNTWQSGSARQTAESKTISIPGTLLISAIGVLKDVRKCVSSDFKSPGNLIVLIGETKEEFGGSHYNLVLGRSGGEVPKVNAKASKNRMVRIHQAIEKGWIRSCHDLSEGGLSVTLSEMCMGGGLGAEVLIPLPPPLEKGERGGFEVTFLFSESASRWLIEIEPKRLSQLQKLFPSSEFQVLGKVIKKPVLDIFSKKERILHLLVSELSSLWNHSPLFRGVSRL